MAFLWDLTARNSSREWLINLKLLYSQPASSLTVILYWKPLILVTSLPIVYTEITVHLCSVNFMLLVFWADFCLGSHVKDLATIKNWDKKDIIFVDNLAQSFANDLENGIPIRPYTSGKSDCELYYLANILEEVNSNTDCIEFLERKFDIKKLMLQC